MAEEIRLLDPAVTVRLRRDARARRLTLRIAARDGSVHLTLPRRTPLAEARDFLARHGPWLAERLRDRAAPAPVGLGSTLPVEGTPRLLVPGPGRTVTLEGPELRIPGAPDRAGPRAAAFLKVLARDRLAAAADAAAARLGRVPGRITLRDPATRWGSCTARGDLMFSWRLVMAPPEVLAYVAAHEVAHLAEMNHSRCFWDLLARLHPDWQRPRAWLRAEGAGLHAWRFG